MASSIFIPLSRIPDFAELRAALDAACALFGLPPPQVGLDSKGPLLTDGFIHITGNHERDRCWISMSVHCAEVTGDEERTVLADVQTRQNWAFAGVVAYALCELAGRIVFNDAGALDGQESYSAGSLRETLARAFGSSSLAERGTA